jgi:hypothetical protein
MRIASSPVKVDFQHTVFAQVKAPKVIATHLIAGSSIGAPNGYASLIDALDGMTRLTDGAKPAAVVFERGGRYYGQLAVETLGGQDTPFHLDAHWRDDVTIKIGTNAAAIVDGMVRLPNDGTLPKWSTLSRKWYQMVEDSYRKPRRPA